MRAKLVNEKFTEQSDPIKDMGIGGFITNKKKIIDMYNKNISGYYLTYDNFLIAYHSNSKKALWDFVDEHEDLNKDNKDIFKDSVHWRIVERYKPLK